MTTEEIMNLNEHEWREKAGREFAIKMIRIRKVDDAIATGQLKNLFGADFVRGFEDELKSRRQVSYVL